MSEASNDGRAVLADLVKCQAAAVLSLRIEGIDMQFPTRFLNDTDEGVWLDAAPAFADSFERLRAEGHPASISFRWGNLWLGFNTTLLRLHMQHRVNADTTVDAALVARPHQITDRQRRAAYRVRVPPGSLEVRIWAIPDHAYLPDRPPASQELKVELRDISVGGLGIWLLPVTRPNPPQLTAGQRLRVLLKWHAAELLLDGRLRLPLEGSDPANATSGVVFKKLDGDPENRRKLSALARIVGQLQRQEIRRLRAEQNAAAATTASLPAAR